MPGGSTVLRSLPDDADWFDDRVRDLVRTLVEVFAGLRRSFGLAEQHLEFVIAEDVADAVRSFAGQTIGTEDLTDFGLERIGGVVAGKTMYRDDAHESAIVVVDAGLFRADVPNARVGEVLVASHELAHTLIGQLRSAGGPPMEPTDRPWLVTCWFARFAFEEYWADVLADLVVSRVGSVSVDGGELRPLAATDFLVCAEDFLAAAVEAFDGLVATIHRYRLGALTLGDMWGTVQACTSALLITLAHVMAEVINRPDYDRPSLPEPLERLWSAGAECFGVQLGDGPADFYQREQEVIGEVGEAVLELWKHIGLTFRDAGDDFYIAVAGPDACWPALLPD